VCRGVVVLDHSLFLFLAAFNSVSLNSTSCIRARPARSLSLLRVLSHLSRLSRSSPLGSLFLSLVSFCLSLSPSVSRFSLCLCHSLVSGREHLNCVFPRVVLLVWSCGLLETVWLSLVGISLEFELFVCFILFCFGGCCCSSGRVAVFFWGGSWFVWRTYACTLLFLFLL
jgi:hypothetical protein